MKNINITITFFHSKTFANVSKKFYVTLMTSFWCY